MFVIGNKQINFAHITMVEWIDGQIDGRNPDTGEPMKVYAFNVCTSYGVIEQIAFKDEELRHQAWESLIDEMSVAGY